MKKINKLLYFTLLPCILACAFLFNPALKAFAEPIVSWGVNPNLQQRTPEPPAGSAALLAENNGIFVAPTQEKKVYFTFDLGFEAGFTGKVLDILKENNIKAVFFLCGNYLKEKDLIDRMIDEGHQIGNHTDRHKDLPTLGDEAIKKDIADFTDKFTAQYSKAALKFFRPPQGRFSARVLKIANEQSLKTMLWSIAIVDWGRAPIDADASAKKIAKRLHSGAIILSHITNAGTPEMIKLLLPKIAENGYTIGSPDELV